MIFEIFNRKNICLFGVITSHCAEMCVCIKYIYMYQSDPLRVVVKSWPGCGIDWFVCCFCFWFAWALTTGRIFLPTWLLCWDFLLDSKQIDSLTNYKLTFEECLAGACRLVLQVLDHAVLATLHAAHDLLLLRDDLVADALRQFVVRVLVDVSELTARLDQRHLDRLALVGISLLL